MALWSRSVAVFAFKEKVTAAKMNKMPRGMSARATLDSNQAGIGSTTAVTDLSGLQFETEANRSIRVELNGLLRTSAADTSAVLTVKNGGTPLFTVEVQCRRASKDQAFCRSKTFTSFASGTNTLNVDAEILTGDLATVTLTAGELTVVDEGPSS